MAMRQVILSLLAGASVSACAGQAGPMKQLGITSVSMRYMRSPHPAPMATGTTGAVAVESRSCLLPRRDRVAVFEALRRAHRLEPLREDVFRIDEDASRGLLIVFRSKDGIQFTAVVPDLEGKQLIRFNGDRARIDPADLAIVQAAAARNGCSNTETRVS